MNAVQGYFEKLGSNFMIAAFIPSFAFVMACMVTFESLLPVTFFERIQKSLAPLGQSGLLALLIAIMMGFTLTSLNTYVYKLFEGYIFFKFLAPLRKLEIKRAHQIRSRYKRVDQKIDRLETIQESWKKAHMPKYNKERQDRIRMRINRFKNQRDAIAADFDSRYPPQENLILPTRFGNILKAAESYPQSRYGIDSVALWPRMVYAIDEKFMVHVDTANDQCSFLLNSSLLSALFAGLSFLASAYQFILLYLLFYKIPYGLIMAGQTNPTLYFQRIFLYFIIGILTLGIAWFFYTASLLNVSKYGSMIRSSYDLFRFDLLERLHLELPPHSNKEKAIWIKISEFVTIGEQFGGLYFDYPSHGPDKDAELEDEISASELSEFEE